MMARPFFLFLLFLFLFNFFFVNIFCVVPSLHFTPVALWCYGNLDDAAAAVNDSFFFFFFCIFLILQGKKYTVRQPRGGRRSIMLGKLLLVKVKIYLFLLISCVKVYLISLTAYLKVRAKSTFTSVAIAMCRYPIMIQNWPYNLPVILKMCE